LRSGHKIEIKAHTFFLCFKETPKFFSPCALGWKRGLGGRARAGAQGGVVGLTAKATRTSGLDTASKQTGIGARERTERLQPTA
jgi:hypothetical protein